MQTEALDEALSTFAATAPQYGRFGLSNHGPMAAEVLEHLGRSDDIAPWVDAYRPRLNPAPPPAPRRLSEEEWPHALGEPDDFPGWLALFEREIADRPVLAVIGEWVPRLVPGTVGAAAHGLIRTAHALRALGAAETTPRRLEVANGLAYWASQYAELPGPPLLIGRQGVEEALAGLPYLPDDVPELALISDRVAHVADIADEFEQAVASLGHSGTAVALLDALAVGGARAYLSNADSGGAIALIHTVTAPLALELVLPWLADEDRVAASAYAWQAVAAIHVAYALDRSEPASDDGPLPAREVLIAAALESGDAHALKLTEAALRCHSRTGRPELLLAAADASRRLRG